MLPRISLALDGAGYVRAEVPPRRNRRTLEMSRSESEARRRVRQHRLPRRLRPEVDAGGAVHYLRDYPWMAAADPEEPPPLPHVLAANAGSGRIARRMGRHNLGWAQRCGSWDSGRRGRSATSRMIGADLTQCGRVHGGEQRLIRTRCVVYRRRPAALRRRRSRGRLNEGLVRVRSSVRQRGAMRMAPSRRMVSPLR